MVEHLFLVSALIASAGPVDAARGVLQRVIPAQAGRFLLEAIPADAGRDVFEIESAGDRVRVGGSSGVAIASGAYWYLKHTCHSDVSWCGDQLRLPATLPRVEKKIRQVSRFKHRYFFNYCAFSYTMAWWDWPQWERMIDWMALHGVNMPLAVTGQEAVWQAVGRRLGISDEQIGRFLVGPAYLPFGWMGCIDGFAGPLTQSWIDRHAELEQKILRRERELGMRPVLQGFTGHVPEAFKEKFPQARLRQLPSWCGFPGTWFVDPLDPLFEQVGRTLLEEQARRFGTDHLYASDTFIEMTPPSEDPAFLADMGRTILRSMRAGDPEAVWVLQGWIFLNNRKFWQTPQTRALLGSVPDDRLIVLDLHADASPVWKSTETFCGKPWIFCALQTFGDVVSLHGGLKQIAANLAEALKSPQGERLCGIGHSMEGLGCNPVVHDFLTDMTWRAEVPPLDAWLAEYVDRRYGRASPAAQKAWRGLLATVYCSPGPRETVICQRPSLHARGALGCDPRLLAAWQHLLEAAPELGQADTYQFDLVNLTRQVLGGLADRIYVRAATAYQAKDRQALGKASGEFLELVSEIDDLLATRRELLLGRWLADAKSWGAADHQQRHYEWNARNQITLWGPRDSMLHDYARKQWSGMLCGFYGPRWRMFFERLDASLAAGKPLDAGQFEKEIQQWEEAWTHGTESYPAAPQGDAVAASRRLWEKYHDSFGE